MFSRPFRLHMESCRKWPKPILHEPKSQPIFAIIKLPAWILLPAMCACSAPILVVWLTGSLALGLLAAAIGAAATAQCCERTLRGVVNTISQIAGGDRYAALPLRIGGGALADSAAAAEKMRQVLIDADALAVDHRSRAAETRLHHAGRGFFTQRFRSTVDKLIGVFQSAGEEIRVTAADLGVRNKDVRAAHRACASMPQPRREPGRSRRRRCGARLAGADR